MVLDLLSKMSTKVQKNPSFHQIFRTEFRGGVVKYIHSMYNFTSHTKNQHNRAAITERQKLFIFQKKTSSEAHNEQGPQRIIWKPVRTLSGAVCPLPLGTP